MERPISIPIRIKELLNMEFYNLKKPLFAQVATISQNQTHIRTMMLYGFNQNEKLIFLSRTDTQKIFDIRINQAISLLIYEPNVSQIIGEGKASIKTVLTNREETEHYWNLMPANIQMIYSASHELNELFGVIEICIHHWEYLVLHSENYTKSERIRCYLTDKNSWQEERLTAI